jgi:hypothetical protein
VSCFVYVLCFPIFRLWVCLMKVLSTLKLIFIVLLELYVTNLDIRLMMLSKTFMAYAIIFIVDHLTFLCKMFYCKCIWFFLEMESSECASVSLYPLNTDSLLRHSETEKLQYSIECYQQYTSGASSRFNYISSMSNKFAAMIDTNMKKSITLRKS